MREIFDNAMNLFSHRLERAIFLLRLIALSLLLFRFPLDLAQSLNIAGNEVLMMEVALVSAFPYFVEIVHIELNEWVGTCLTKEE